MKKIIFSTIIALLTASSFAQNLSARILRSGCFDCFQDGLKMNDSTPIYCEASACLSYQKQIFIASDKAIPGKSSLFSFKLSDFKSFKMKYVQDTLIQTGAKFEDMALSSNKEFVFLTTSFDRVDINSNKLDNYNMLLYWKNQEGSPINILERTENKGKLSSLNLRKKILDALKSIYPNSPTEYFKIEGICILPDQRLLLGIRELGKDYANFQYKVLILESTYLVERDEIRINSKFKKALEFTPKINEEVDKYLGLSGLVYDSQNQQIYLLTSFEKNEGDLSGAFLWNISLTDYEKQGVFQPVKNEMGQIIEFADKAEGLCMLKKNTLFVICDADRYLGVEKIEDPIKDFQRKPNQATYYVLKINK